MRIIFTSFVCLFISFQVIAQNNLGARFSSMGGASTAMADRWSINANPAGISQISTTNFGFNYTQFNLSSELSEQNFIVLQPVKTYILGLSINRYGISEYTEIKAGIALARNFGKKLALALKVNYHQLKISNYGSTQTFSIDVGASYQLNNLITLGIYTHNPSGQQFKSLNIQANIPQGIHLGAAYSASDNLILAFDISRELEQKTDMRVGVDYRMMDVLSLRGGIAAKPFMQSVGFGLHLKKFNADVAVQSHPQLGYTPQIGISYAL